MRNHKINAGNDGFRWTIVLDPNGNGTREGPLEFTTANLDTFFECDCGVEFDTRDEAVAHLNDIDADENGETVPRLPNTAEQ